VLILFILNYTFFSKLGVRIFGETEYQLVSPLIDSLFCDLSHTGTPRGKFPSY
jgi:hypothetical protein